LNINLHLNNDLGGELIPEGALTSFNACDAYRYFAGQALLMTSQYNKVIYTAQIRQGRKSAFSRQFWRGKFSVYL